MKFLVIANDSRGPAKATVKVEGILNATAMNIADESRLNIVDGSLNLELAPLASGEDRLE